MVEESIDKKYIKFITNLNKIIIVYHIMNIIIPLCGIGKRFQDAGYDSPKPLIKIFNKTIIHRVLDCLDVSKDDKIFIIYHNSLDEYNFSINPKNNPKNNPNVVFIPIYKRTLGAAETVKIGIEEIKKQEHLKSCLIIDCDTVYNTNILKKIRKLKTNGVVYFEDVEINPIYSYITLEDDKITDIKEKEKISNYANTGAYYFTDINELHMYCKKIIENNIMCKNEYYTSCVIKEMLVDGKEYKGIKINKSFYTSFGTPEDVEEYKKRHISFLFDLDGTIVKTDAIYFKVWSTILSTFNITLTDSIFSNFIQGNNDFFTMKKLKIKDELYNLDDISTLKDTLFLKNINDIDIMEGVQHFIKMIKKLGHSVAIVSNCNKIICEEILKHIKIRKYIDHIVTGNECDNPKPYPDPYFKAMSLFDTTRDKCIIFEDSKTGLLSALNAYPKIIIGVDNGTNSHILDELNIEFKINTYTGLEIPKLIDCKLTNNMKDIKDMIYNSIQKKYDIANIELDLIKLKGGYISDVIKVTITLKSGDVLNCVLKYENDYKSSLIEMAYNLDLFNREYYFYENISNYININTPKYISTIKDSNFKSKGILLENINRENFKLGLNLNKENIDVSFKVIEQCSKFHSSFWNKDLSKSFTNIRKHNDTLFNPFLNNFITEKWPLFIKKWSFLIDQPLLIKLEKIISTFSSIQENLSKGHLTLCHGDVKSGNIFYELINDTYMPHFIDWQYIAHGKGVQDIVFFIIESFDIEHIEQYTNIFKKYYYIKLKEYGVKYSEDDYNKDFMDAISYFPLFVALWFGTSPEDELIDASFPFVFIQKFLYFVNVYIN